MKRYSIALLLLLLRVSLFLTLASDGCPAIGLVFALDQAPSTERFNVTLCCVGLGCNPDIFPVTYFTAAVGWWQGQSTLDLDAARAPAANLSSRSSVWRSAAAGPARRTSRAELTGLGRGAVVQQQDINVSVVNPFDDPQVGLGAGWPRLKVVDFRIMTKGGSPLARDMLRTYIQLNADAVCDLIVGPTVSYVALAFGAVVEHPLWVDFASERLQLGNITTYMRVNPNLDDLTNVIVGILQSLQKTLAIHIPSVTVLASTDSYSAEFVSVLLPKLAAVGIEVEFTIMLSLDTTREQARQTLAELRTARSRVVIPAIQMSPIVTLWGYLNEAFLDAVAAGQYDFIIVFATGACGRGPVLPGMLCGLTELNATQADAFYTAYTHQPRSFTDDIARRQRAMNWPLAPPLGSIMQLGAGAMAIDAVTFGLGAINAFVTQNNRMPHTSAEIYNFAVEGSTTNTINGPNGFVEPQGISGTVHVSAEGHRLSASMEILNYQVRDIVRVGSFDTSNRTVSMDPSALYLRGGYYLRPMRTPPGLSDAGSGARRTPTFVVPVVVSAVCGSALIAAMLAGCCWWRRRWPSRDARLARANKWAVRGVLPAGPSPGTSPSPRRRRHGRDVTDTRNRLYGGGALVVPALFPEQSFSSSTPTAAVTAIWTDIEKSTALWAQLPHAMGHAIDAYHTLIRALIWAHHGYETRTAGDAFMVVFGNAADAVEFSLVLQLALVRDVPWAALASAPATPAKPRPSGGRSASIGSEPAAGPARPGTEVAKALESSPGVDPFEAFYRANVSGTSNPSPPIAGPTAASASHVANDGDSGTSTASDPQQPPHLWAGLRVRIGLATGIAAVNTDSHTGAYDYAGQPVDDAARICLLARGGQTVMTETSLRAALAHAGLDPATLPSSMMKARQRDQTFRDDDRSHKRAPFMLLGWLRPDETVGLQVPKLARGHSHSNALGLGLTFGDEADVEAANANDARLLAPPRGGRAPPYERPTDSRGGMDTVRAAEQVFPSSTYVRPLGVYGIDMIRQFSPSNARTQGDSAAHIDADLLTRDPLGERTLYQCLYQALPSPLARRKFAALRLKLLPGVAKYRDANGQPSGGGRRSSGGRRKHEPPAPAAIATTAATRAVGHVTFAGDGPTPSGPTIPSASPTGGSSAVIGPPAAGVPPPARLPIASLEADKALAVFLGVLLAPVTPQQRHAMLGELSAAWRLPAVVRPRGAAAAAPTAADVDAAARNDQSAVDSLAQRCAGVYSAGRRGGSAQG